MTDTLTANRMSIAARTTAPCRMLPAIFPNVNVSPAGIARTERTCRKSVSGVGFSKGCAEFALKKPPPFVPNSLMAS